MGQGSEDKSLAVFRASRDDLRRRVARLLADLPGI